MKGDAEDGGPVLLVEALTCFFFLNDMTLCGAKNSKGWITAARYWKHED